MTDSFNFHPPRRRGILFHCVLIIAFGALSALAFMFGLNQQTVAYFVLLLFTSLLLFAPIPWLIYRVYALSRATYRLERDGLRLRWGLRAEDIPLPDIEWIRQPADLAVNLPQPRLSWPGAILGAVNTPDLGNVEYLASSSETLLLIATSQRVYAISPEDPNAFLRAFQDALEMGSLTPISSVSVLPGAYLTQILSVPAARILLGMGFVLNLLLFTGVSLIIPSQSTASLGFYPNGAPLPPVPAAQMLLLPFLGAFTYIVDLGAGLFFFRRESYRLLAFLLWGSAVASAVLLILSAVTILIKT